MCRGILADVCWEGISFEEVLSIAGVYKFCPILLPLTVGKAKKDHALGESHHTDGGGQRGR